MLERLCNGICTSDIAQYPRVFYTIVAFDNDAPERAACAGEAHTRGVRIRSHVTAASSRIGTRQHHCVNDVLTPSLRSTRARVGKHEDAPRAIRAQRFRPVIPIENRWLPVQEVRVSRRERVPVEVTRAILEPLAH